MFVFDEWVWGGLGVIWRGGGGFVVLIINFIFCSLVFFLFLNLFLFFLFCCFSVNFIFFKFLLSNVKFESLKVLEFDNG